MSKFGDLLEKLEAIEGKRASVYLKARKTTKKEPYLTPKERIESSYKHLPIKTIGQSKKVIEIASIPTPTTTPSP